MPSERESDKTIWLRVAGLCAVALLAAAVVVYVNYQVGGNGYTLFLIYLIGQAVLWISFAIAPGKPTRRCPRCGKLSKAIPATHNQYRCGSCREEFTADPHYL